MDSNIKDIAVSIIGVGDGVAGSAATAVASTCASALGIGTAPAWAVPCAVVGGLAAIGAGMYGVGRYCKWW